MKNKNLPNLMMLLRARILYIEKIQGYDLPHPHKLLCINYLDSIKNEFNDAINAKLAYLRLHIDLDDQKDNIISYFNEVVEDVTHIYYTKMKFEESIISDMDKLLKEDLYKEFKPMKDTTMQKLVTALAETDMHVNVIMKMQKDKPLDEICVIGYPSKVGGADTELDHQIRIWQKLGIKVYLLHTGIIDQNLKNMKMEDRGCVILEPEKWSKCKGKYVISYCNDRFLKNLDVIKEFAKKTIWVNCMCYLFPDEIKAHKSGLIDWFVYQTDHVRLKVQDELMAYNPTYRWAKVRPYFDKGDFEFITDRPNDKFRFGRVSRADADKFHPMTLWIYETMTSPVLKEGMILGINDNVKKKIGNPQPWIKCYDAGQIPAKDVYKFSDAIITANGNYENLPRIAFESMASGCLLIADNKGGWKEQIQHGKTGFLCSNEREFAYYASRAAHEVAERKQMVQNAYEWLNTEWGEESAKQEWTKFFAKMVSE